MKDHFCPMISCCGYDILKQNRQCIKGYNQICWTIGQIRASILSPKELLGEKERERKQENENQTKGWCDRFSFGKITDNMGSFMGQDY